MRSSHNRFPEALALSTALILTGCTVNDNEPPTPPPSDMRIDNDTLTQYYREHRHDDPCNPTLLDIPKQDQQGIEKAAVDCAHIYKMGTVALVNYDVPLPVAEKLAERTEALIRQASNDEISLDISVVEPSQLARDKFKEAIPDNCYDLSGNNIAQYGSAIADFTMPDKLNDKDYVVSLTSAIECGSINRHAGRQGLSLSALGNRFVEVLDADPAMSHPEGTPFLDDAATVTHELFHNLGLGHAGNISFPTDKNPFGFENVPSAQMDIDLDALLAVSQYNEYGDNANTQGNNATIYSDAEFPIVRLNAIQRERLHWTKYATSSTQPRKEQSVNETSTRLDTTDTQSFATIDLAQPIQLTDPDSSPQPQLFQKLAIIPNKMNDVYNTELFLTNTTGFTVRIGTIHEITPNWNISLGGKLISINYTNDGLFAKAIDQ